MKVNLKISSVNFDVDKKLIEFIHEKVDKLANYYDKIIDIYLFKTTTILKIIMNFEY